MNNKYRFLIVILLLLSCAAYGRNYFSAFHSDLQLLYQPVILSSVNDKGEVAQFDRFEAGFNMPRRIDSLIRKQVLNPFDPSDINVIAIFTNGRQSDTVFGFYFQNFERDQKTIAANYSSTAANWNSIHAGTSWRVRYTPEKIGTYTLNITVRAYGTLMYSFALEPVSFTVVSSSLPGFLSLGNDGLHFIESNLKKSFFLLGQDIAWPDGSRFRGGANPVYPQLVSGGYMDVLDWVSNLGANGGNTIRVVNVPWSYELEWDTIGVYNMQHAWELDSLFVRCESSGVKMIFCMEHATHRMPTWPEEHLTWEKNPYNRFLKGVDVPDDFLADSAARRHYRNKLRYFFARWGYSTSLGIFQLLSEMEDWSYKGGKLQDNKDAQRAQLAWHSEMLRYAKWNVSYRPLLTSTSYAASPRDFAINAFSSPYVDVVAPRHCYFTERYDNRRRFGEINGVGIGQPGVHDLFPDKPAIIDETGFGGLGADPNDMDANTDVTFHNTLWATSFSGTAGAGLYWWQWNSNEYREKNFPALRAFFQDVNFEAVPYNRPGHWEDAARASKVNIETFYLTSSDQTRAHCIGWVHNASYWWGNLVNGFIDRSGKSTIINSRTGDDESVSSPRELPTGTKFEVHDLANGTNYILSWYNTRGAGGAMSSEEVRTNIFGTAKVSWRAGAADWSYKMVRKEESKNLTLIQLLPDTVVAGEVIPVFGNHPADTLGTFSYRWDFGNGLASNLKNTDVTYTPGKYHANLVCRDATGQVFVMQQDVIALRANAECVGFVEKRSLSM